MDDSLIGFFVISDAGKGNQLGFYKVGHRMKKNPNLRRYPISTLSGETVLKGYIEYWSKDYRVVLEKPIHKEGINTHMMYMAPARFVTPFDKKDTIKNVKDVDIVDRCKTILQTLYEEG
jgi:hypothetical protein